jgi:predicted enzyme related to lactoylglutathione lyase
MAPTLGNGKICYLEIPTVDIARSVRFYRKVFGWRTRQREDGSAAFDDGVGEVSGGWVTDRPPSAHPGLLLHVMVEDMAAALDAITAGGGRIVQPPDPGASEVTARFADPDGNVLGLYQEGSLSVRS